MINARISAEIDCGPLKPAGFERRRSASPSSDKSTCASE